MATIHVSGIPRGLNYEDTCPLIRNSITTVAQVDKVWIDKDKGYGFVTLFDPASMEEVLSLDKKINVNGCLLRLGRKRPKCIQIKKTKPLPVNLVKPVTNTTVSMYAIRYNTYTGYKEDTPETDTLFEYAKPVLPRGLQKKRKSWKNTVRLSCIPTPRSGKVHKKHGQRKKKKQPRSQRVYCTNGKHRDKKKENLTPHSHSKEMEKDADTTHQRSDTGLARVRPLPIRTDDDIIQPVQPRVHVYDHGKYLFDIDVDNYNVFHSINDEVSKKCNIPVPHFMLEYNGKTVNSNWPLHVRNGENVHLIVKGKGGMKEGDDSAQSNDKKNDGTLAKPIAESILDGQQDSEVSITEASIQETNDVHADEKLLSMKEKKEVEDHLSSTGVFGTSGVIGGHSESGNMKIDSSLEFASIKSDVDIETITLPSEKQNESHYETPQHSQGDQTEVILHESWDGNDNTSPSIKEPKESSELSISREVMDSGNMEKHLSSESTTRETHEDLDDIPPTQEKEIESHYETPQHSQGDQTEVILHESWDGNDNTSPSIKEPKESIKHSISREVMDSENLENIPPTQEKQIDTSQLREGSGQSVSTLYSRTSDIDTGEAVDDRQADSFERRPQSSEAGQDENQLSLVDGDNTPASIKELNDGIASVSTESSSGLNNQNESTSKEADMPLEHTTKDNTSFSELPKDQQEILETFGLKKYFPSRLTYDDIMKITKEEKETETTLAGVPFIILRKLIMLDYSGRENVLHGLYRKKGKQKMCKYNPVDIILSMFLCLNPSLKTIFCSKMFMCHMALPMIYRSPVLKEKLNFWVWPLHNIVVNDGDVERNLVNSDQYVVSLVRLGRPHISKSRIANEILHDTAFHTFFNYDCKLGSSKKRCSRGLIEAAWYIPSSKENESFKKLTLILNLRGNSLEHEKQMAFLKTVSNVIIIVTTQKTLEKTDFAQYSMGSVHVVFLIDNDDDGNDDDSDGDDDYDDNDDDDVPRYKTYPDNAMLHFLNLKEFGQQLSMSEIKESVFCTILSTLSETKTIKQMCSKAKKLDITIDTDNCGVGRIKADELFAIIKDEPLHRMKTRFTPLQTDLWKVYSDTEKKLRNGSHLNLQDKNKLSEKMIEQRKAQVERYKKELRPNAVVEFMNFLDLFKDRELYYFLETLKLHLDDKKRKEIPAYQDKYEAAHDCAKSQTEEEKQSNQTRVERAEQNLREASFGIEHLFREFGQIFEAHTRVGDTDFNGCKLARAVAKSILLGYPFEIMDGDVANIPLGWIKAVFSELKDVLGDKKVGTLSILGLESSGKSTLLNAMFGLSFNVSVGRCTRGINMRLLPVAKGMFDFDYVLVVDTEGLRTTELGRKSYQHDNALATVVIGMADISIINIKGENTTEIKDILQICVHAFLRLQLANKDLKLRQSCVFIHQNVPAINAKKKMSLSMRKLEETLDRITLEAAIEENISNITRFSEVIEFDINKHVWYFPDLWKGDPPMAPVNPGYSTSIRDVKFDILENLARNKTLHGNIFDIFNHLRDLWNGILANDFVFSFRNSIEMRNYNTLEAYFTNYVWDLECFMNEVVIDYGLQIKKYETYDDFTSGISELEKQTNTKFTEKGIEIKEYLKSLFEDSKHKSEFIQWKSTKLIAWDNEFERFKSILCQEIASLQQHHRMHLDMKDSLDKNKRELVEKATDLAEKYKGKEIATIKVAEEFDKMWTTSTSKLNIQEKYEDVHEILRVILYERFKRVREQIDPEIERFDKWKGKRKLERLENSLDKVDFESYITVKYTWNPLELLNKKQKKLQRNKQAISFINVILREIDTKLDNISKSVWKFNETEVKEITKCIIDRIDEYNKDTTNYFTISERCKIMLNVVVFHRCVPLFEQKIKEYRDKYSMKAKLDAQRRVVWGHFIDKVQQKSSDVVARNRFCDVIRGIVEENVKQQIPDLIYVRITEMFQKAKHELCIGILEDLAEKEQLYLYVLYISDPYTYASRWISDYIDRKCFADGLYYEYADMETNRIVTMISDTVRKARNENLNEWLNTFEKETENKLPISSESFSLVREQTVSDMEEFRNKLIQELKNMSEEIKDNFSKDSVSSITWQNRTPSEKVIEKLWGCKCVCPFCKEPCQWNTNHGASHACIQHRPVGLSGCHWKRNKALTIESCSFLVQSDNGFNCGRGIALCERESGKCKKTGKSEEFHSYKEYKTYASDWNIHPCHDISSSIYWAWVMCKFNKDLAKIYSVIEAAIPSTWTSYTKKEAIESLRRT